MGDALPRVSVVVPFYNSNAYLQEALDSIMLSRSVAEVFVVVDEGSESPLFSDPDGLVTVVNNKSTDFRGPGVVREIGFRKAKSRFVAFLDADDRWLPGKADVQLQVMLKNKLAFSFHDYINFDGSGRTGHISQIPPFTIHRFLGKGFTIGCLTVMIDKSLVPELQANNLARRNDYFMWFNAMKYMDELGLQWGGFSYTGAEHRLHRGSLTASRFKSVLAYWKFLALCEKSLRSRIWIFARYIVNSRKNRSLTTNVMVESNEKIDTQQGE